MEQFTVSVIIISLLLLFDCTAASTHKHDRLRDAEVTISSWSGCTITGTVDGTPVTLFMDPVNCPLRAKVPGKFWVRFDRTCGAVVEMTDGPRIETPMPPSCPTPTPEPTPQPTPEPTPDAPCTIEAPTVVALPRNGTGSVSVTLTGATGEVRATSSSPGQLSIAPLTKQIAGTSNVVAFSLRVKKQNATATFVSSCGSRVTNVTVR